MKPNVVVIHPKDNVAVALEDIPKGQTVRPPDGEPFPALSDLPYSHKVLLRDLTRGAEIVKYGEVIGRAGADLGRGEWLHTHNLVPAEE